MSEIDNDLLIGLVISALPYSEQTTGWDTTKTNCIYFDWRGARYKVSTTFHVELIEGALATSDNTCILMRKLIMLQYANQHS